jgi:hypothetical protein
MTQYYVIRKVDTKSGIITTIAGYGRPPAPDYVSVNDGAPAISDSILTAEICVDNSGNLYFGSSNRIRKVNTTTGIISTLLGPGIPNAQGQYPTVGQADSVACGPVRSLVF